MVSVASFSHRVRKPLLHISLSFHPQDNLSGERMLEVAFGYLMGVGIKKENHQIAIFEHKDRPYRYFHIYINRVSLELEPAISDAFFYYRNMKVCRSLEEKYDLVRFKSGPSGDSDEYTIRDKNVGKLRVREFVRTAIQDATKAGVHTLDRLADVLALQQIDTQWRLDETGERTGVAFRYNNIAVTGRMVGFPFPVLKKFIAKD